MPVNTKKIETLGDAALAMQFAHSKACAQMEGIVKDANCDMKTMRAAALAAFSHRYAMNAYALLSVGATSPKVAHSASIDTIRHGGADFDEDALRFIEAAADTCFRIA